MYLWKGWYRSKVQMPALFSDPVDKFRLRASVQSCGFVAPGNSFNLFPDLVVTELLHCWQPRLVYVDQAVVFLCLFSVCVLMLDFRMAKQPVSNLLVKVGSCHSSVNSITACDLCVSV